MRASVWRRHSRRVSQRGSIFVHNVPTRACAWSGKDGFFVAAFGEPAKRNKHVIHKAGTAAVLCRHSKAIAETVALWATLGQERMIRCLLRSKRRSCNSD